MTINYRTDRWHGLRRTNSEFEYWNFTYAMPADCTGNVLPRIRLEIESTL